MQQGARHAIMASRSGPHGGGIQSLVDKLKTLGASLNVYSCDISNQDELRRVIDTDAASMPPICGVIQAAMVLRGCRLSFSLKISRSTATKPSHQDGIRNITSRSYMVIVRPKVRGTWNIHEVLSNRHLEFFIMLSSMTGFLGPLSQAVYAGISTFMGAFAHFRVAQGLPADTIHLGAVAGVGYLADRPELMGGIAKGDGGQLLERARRARSDQRVDSRTAGRDRRQRVPHRLAVEARQNGRRVLGPRRLVLALPESHLRRRRRPIIHVQNLRCLVAFFQAPPGDFSLRRVPICLRILGREIRFHPHDSPEGHHADQARRGVRAGLARRDRDSELAGSGTRSEGAIDGVAVRELADGFGGVGGWKVGDRRSERS